MRLGRHRKIHGLRMREALSEDDDVTLPDDAGGAGADEVGFELDDVDPTDLLSAAASSSKCVTRMMSDQDGELWYINLRGLKSRVRQILCGKDGAGFADFGGRTAEEENVCDAVMRCLPEIVPPAFRRCAEAFASGYSSSDGDGVSAIDAPLFDALALTNGHQSIMLLKCLGTRAEWFALIDAEGGVKAQAANKSAVAAYLVSMFPRNCQLRSTSAFHLDVSDRFLKDCGRVEETMRTGTLLMRGSSGLAGGVWMVEGIDAARSALGLEPIYLPGSIDVSFDDYDIYNVTSITKVHELQKRIHSIEFPDSVRDLGDNVFAGLRLRKVFIPRTVTYGVGFLRSIENWGNMPVIVAFECDEHCLTAERVRAAVDKGAFQELDIRFGVTRERFRSIGVSESLTNDGAEEDAGLELDVGEPARPYNPYLHDENDRGDRRNLATNDGDAEELIRAHRDERVWTLTYSDGEYEDGELDGHDYGGRRVMTYDDALAAWQAYPLDAELRAAVGDGGYEDGHYELHILLNYAAGLDRCDSEDDREWDWDSLIPVADRYVLYDSDED